MCVIVEISNRYVLCIRLIVIFLNISVYIGEILVNLQISSLYFRISPLYVVKSVKSLIFVFWYPLSNLCVQVSGCWLQERKGRDHYLFSETISYLLVTFVYIYIVHFNSNPVLWIVSLIWSFGFTFKSSIYWAILRFLQYFWGFHPCILWNLQNC